MPTSTITNTITGPSGAAIAGVPVIAQLMPGPGFRGDGTEVAGRITTTSNGSGAWSLVLERNSNISNPTGSWWRIEEDVPKAQGGSRAWAISVGALDATLAASLTTPSLSTGLLAYLTQSAGDARYLAAGASLGWVDVKRDFGAVGDGSANDTAALQNAIGSLASTGGVIFLPRGAYKITSGLTIAAGTNDISVVGAGMHATTINHTGSDTAFTSNGTSPSAVCRRIFLKNFALTGTSSATGGIRFNWTIDWGLDDLYVSGFTGTNIIAFETFNSWYGRVLGGRLDTNNINMQLGQAAAQTNIFGTRFLDASGIANVIVGPSGTTPAQIGFWGASFEIGSFSGSANLLDINNGQGINIHGCYFEFSGGVQTGSAIGFGQLLGGGSIIKGVSVEGGQLTGNPGLTGISGAGINGINGFSCRSAQFSTWNTDIGLNSSFLDPDIGTNSYSNVTNIHTGDPITGDVTLAAIRRLVGRVFHVIGTAAKAAYIHVERHTTGLTALEVQVTGEAQPRYLVDSSGKVFRGTGGAVPGVINGFGPGTPEGVVTGAVSSTWQRTDGGAATSFYVKESGSGNTGWIGK